MPNTLDVEFEIKYEWQPLQFLHKPPPCHFFTSLVFTLPKQNYAAEVNCLVALHELYKYINKYYDQVSIREVHEH